MNITINKKELFLQTFLYGAGIYYINKFVIGTSKLILINGTIILGVYSLTIRKRYNVNKYFIKLLTFGGITINLFLTMGIMTGGYYCIYLLGKGLLRNIHKILSLNN